MGKKNIVFNLTIDDLKELGIIKPRRRRRKTNRIMQYLQKQQQPNNIKSTSEQMTGYSNVFNSNNTSNLQTENLRLQNNLLDKYPMLKNEANNNNESRLKTIEDGNNKNNEYISYILQSAYGGEFSYRPMTKYKSLRSQPLIEEPPEKDNIDVAATAGSEGFKSLDNDKNDNDDNNNIDTNIPNTPQLGIRPPQGVDNNNENEEANPIDTTFNDVDSVHSKNEESEEEDSEEGDSEGEDSVEEDSEEDSEEDLEEEPVAKEPVKEPVAKEPVKEPIKKPAAKPTAKPQTRSQANPQSKRKSQPAPKEETLFEQKAIYTQLGGKDNDILTSKYILPVRDAITILRREAKKKVGKK